MSLPASTARSRADTREVPKSGAPSYGGDAMTPAARALLVIVQGSGSGLMYGVQGATIIGRHPSADVRLADHAVSRHHAAIREDRAGGFVIEDLDSKNGTQVNGRTIRRAPLRPGDQITLGAGTQLLFTDYRDIEERVGKAQQLQSLGELAGGVAHDFANLLSIMLANIQYLQSLPRVGDGEVRERLQDIEITARSATRLTSQLLGQLRGRQWERHQVDLAEVLRETADLLGRTFGPRIRVEADVEADLAVQARRAQMGQMVMNLCLNARDAMPDGGTLTLSGRTEFVRPSGSAPGALPPGLYAVVTISDTGCGMDAETLSKATQPFFTTKGSGGTGIGLTTVKRIVQEHAGHLSIQSSPGKGSTFRIYLPRALAPDDPGATGSL